MPRDALALAPVKEASNVSRYRPSSKSSLLLIGSGAAAKAETVSRQIRTTDRMSASNFLVVFFHWKFLLNVSKSPARGNTAPFPPVVENAPSVHQRRIYSNKRAGYAFTAPKKAVKVGYICIGNTSRVEKLS